MHRRGCSAAPRRKQQTQGPGRLVGWLENGVGAPRTTPGRGPRSTRRKLMLHLASAAASGLPSAESWRRSRDLREPRAETRRSASAARPTGVGSPMRSTARARRSSSSRAGSAISSMTGRARSGATSSTTSARSRPRPLRRARLRHLRLGRRRLLARGSPRRSRGGRRGDRARSVRAARDVGRLAGRDGLCRSPPGARQPADPVRHGLRRAVDVRRPTSWPRRRPSGA